MPSSRRQKSKAKAALARRPAHRKAAAKPAPKAPPPKAKPARGPAPKPGTAGKAPVAEIVPPRRTDGRIHVLSLSFVREGDEFLARLETDGGQITELKNRSLDQLLTLVASELEDLLE